MALNLEALKAKLASQKTVVPAAPAQETNNENNTSTPTSSSIPNTPAVAATVSSPASGTTEQFPTVSAPEKLGTSKTSEIDHMDFLSKMNSLSEAIHKQHPTMPVLLMQIHKQLRSDPELVTTLDDDAIGIIVKGLQVQTKTELVVAATSSKGSGKKKGAAVSVDML